MQSFIAQDVFDLPTTKGMKMISPTTVSEAKDFFNEVNAQAIERHNLYIHPETKAFAKKVEEYCHASIARLDNGDELQAVLDEFTQQLKVLAYDIINSMSNHAGDNDSNE